MENEVRLIDANALVLENSILMEDEYGLPFKCVLAEDIRYAPTVDAEPVVHGHWVKHNFLGHEQYACSECQTLGSPQWKRCPVCEVKMDGERREGE